MASISIHPLISCSMTALLGTSLRYRPRGRIRCKFRVPVWSGTVLANPIPPMTR